MQIKEHLCEDCKVPIWIKEKDWISHRAAFHPQIIAEQSIQSLITIKDKVRYLLQKFPQARSNDKLLYQKFLQYCTNYLVYNEQLQTIQPRTSQGWTFEEWLKFPHFETIRRSRQHLQEKEPELRASPKITMLRDIKEEAYHRHFANEKEEY